MIAREELAGAAQARLDLVGHEQDVLLATQRGERREPAVGRNQDAGLRLDRLDEHGAGVWPDGAPRRRDVTKRNDPEARREWPEATAILGRAGEADDGRRAAVEVVLEDDDLRLVGRNALDLVAPAPSRLDGGFDCLGARVHREHHLHAAELGELLAEERELVVAEGA